MKFSILMPTYNDSETIIETLKSVINQTYDNWELIIVDDGSNDNTKESIMKFKEKYDNDNRLLYLYQENSDQLNAIKKGIDYITGDYVCVLHSDDLLYDENTLSKINKYLKENRQYDGIISDLTIIDKNSNVTGKQSVLDYTKSEKIIPMELLWLGRNLYVDVAFHKKESFMNYVKYNYLDWNGPFWLCLKEKPQLLNIKKVDIPFYKYRVYSENYINNLLGRLCVINGEIRVVSNLLKYYNIPFYKIQYTIFRIFNKLGLAVKYNPIYSHREEKHKSKIISYVLSKRFNKKEIASNDFLDSVLKFYKNYKKRSIKISKIDEKETIYLGSDMRLFYKNLNNKKISTLYKSILKEMKTGFNEIIVYSEKDLIKVENITKFLCIYPYTKITIA